MKGGFIRSGLGGNCDELITHEGESYQVWARRELDCCCREKKLKRTQFISVTKTNRVMLELK